MVMLISWRYVATAMLEASRMVGRIRGWLASGWLRGVLLVIAAALGAWLAELAYKTAFPTRPIPAGTWTDSRRVMAVVALVGLLWWTWRVRRAVVIDQFADFTTSDSKKSPARGLSLLLFAELARIRDLYRSVEEAGAIRTAVAHGNGFEAMLKLDDPSEFLRSAVSAESQLSLGPLRVPVGALMALFGRMTRSRRITGSLHRDGNAWVLTAQMVGPDETHCWRVQAPQPADTGPSTASALQGAADTAPDVRPLVEELAVRIYADLALASRVRWAALRLFLEALAAYRDCLLAPKHQQRNLKTAERKLIEALSEDVTFHLAYYNLGVVYTTMGRPTAALTAFSKAQSRSPDSWEPYYALAKHQFDRAMSLPEDSKEKNMLFDNVIANSKRVIDLSLLPATSKVGRPLSADLALAYDLKGRAERLKYGAPAALPSRKRAVALAWKALCQAEREAHYWQSRQTHSLPLLHQITGTCLRNLAVLHAYLWDDAPARSRRKQRHLRRAEVAFKQATALQPSVEGIYVEMGKTLEAAGKYEQAEREIEKAVRINASEPALWALLAQVQAEQVAAFRQQAEAHERSGKRYASALVTRRRQVVAGKIADALQSCDRALDQRSNALKADLEMVANAYRRLSQVENAQRVEDLIAFKERLSGYERRGLDALPDLEREKQAAENKDWEAAQICIVIGGLMQKPEDAEVAYREAIDRLKREHSSEIRLYGLRAQLAYALRNQSKFADALEEAEAALRDDPVGHFEWEAVGHVYAAMGEFELARNAWENARLWRPNEPRYYRLIAQCYWALASNHRDPRLREEGLREGIRVAEEALGFGDPPTSTWIHYWLAHFAFELREYPKAISHWAVIQHHPWAKAIAPLYLGEVYLRYKSYEECIESFQRAVGEAQELIDERQQPTELLGKDFDDNPIPIGVVLGFARWGLAFCRAERGVDLDEAASLIEQARPDRAIPDGYWRKRLQAFCDDCEGWILLKRSIVNSTSSLDQAIELFQASLRGFATPEAHYHLAMGYHLKLAGCADKAERQRYSRLGMDHIRQAQDLDLRGEFSQRLHHLIEDFGGGKPEPKSPSPAASKARSGAKNSVPTGRSVTPRRRSRSASTASP